MFIETWKCLGGGFGKKAPPTLPSAGNRAMVPCKLSRSISSRAAAGSKDSKWSPTTWLADSSVPFLCPVEGINIWFDSRTGFWAFSRKIRAWQSGRCWKTGEVGLNVFMQRRQWNLGWPLFWLRNGGTSDGNSIPWSHIYSLTVIHHFLMTRRGKSTVSIQYCSINHKFSARSERTQENKFLHVWGTMVLAV